jgi:RNA polymerase sigma-70 factor (ECF subfamily)
MPEFYQSDASHDDALLVRAVTGGNTEAFKKLVHQYERLVCSIVFKMIDQKQDREDICQEVFIKVYDKLPHFLFQSRLSTWIGNIAFNHSVNFLKKKKLVLLEDLGSKAGSGEENFTEISFEPKDADMTPDERLLNKEKKGLLGQRIESLPLIQKTILQLFHREEMSLEEIATITALPINTVKSHLFRARKTLKNEMVKQLNQ